MTLPTIAMLVTLAFSAGAAGCKPAPAPTPEAPPLAGVVEQIDTTTPEDSVSDQTPVAQLEPEPVEAQHYVFIGRPQDVEPLDCAIWDTSAAPHRRVPQMLHDATDYPERHHVSFEVVAFVQTPEGVAAKAPAPRQIAAPGSVVPATVAFALAPLAFRSSEQRAAPTSYDAGYCERLNRLLASPYVVIHAYKVHVDRGNSLRDAWSETFGSLGTDPGKANAGFATLDEAQAFAAALLPERG